MILYPISSTEQTTELVLSCRLRYIAYTSQYLVRLSYLVFQCESLLRICSVLLVIESMLLLQQNGSVLLVLVFATNLIYLYNVRPFTLTLKCRYSVFVGYLLTNNNR